MHDYESLCSLDCLGIEEKHQKTNDFVYEEFRKQLGRGPEGYYETNLIWKESHPKLLNNEYNSIGRLQNLTRNLIRRKKLDQYDQIMQEQKDEGIIEQVQKKGVPEKGKVFYMPRLEMADFPVFALYGEDT